MFISSLEKGVFTDVNSSFCKLTGYTREEIIGHSSLEYEIISPEKRMKILEELKGKGKIDKINLQIHSKSGEIKDLILSAEIIELSCEKFIISSGIDITERKKAEEQLKESKQLLQDVLDVLPVGIFIADNKGNIAQTNAAAEKIWGGTKHISLDRLHEYKGWWKDSRTQDPIPPEAETCSTSPIKKRTGGYSCPCFL